MNLSDIKSVNCKCGYPMQRLFSTFHIAGSSIPFNNNENYALWSKPNEPPIKSRSELKAKRGKDIGSMQDLGFNSLKQVKEFGEHTHKQMRKEALEKGKLRE